MFQTGDFIHKTVCAEIFFMNNIVYAGKHSLTFSVSRHAHTSLEFIYCTEGKGALTFDDNFTLSYEAGDVAIIPPFIPHSNTSSEGFCNIHINMLDPKLTIKTPALIHDDINKFILNAFTAAILNSINICIHCRSAMIICENFSEKKSDLPRTNICRTKDFRLLPKL